MDERDLSYSLKRSQRTSLHKASVMIQKHLEMVESKENEEPQTISPAKTASSRNIQYLTEICVNANGYKIPCASERLPTHWHSQCHSPTLSVIKNKGNVAVKYIGPSEEGLIRAIRPIPSDCLVYYFEVEVVRGGKCLAIGIGTLDVPLNYFPGWGDDSQNHRTYGYHSDDGKYFSTSWDGMKYAPTYGLGDVVGCALDFGRKLIFFTKNGQDMGVAERNLNLDDSFYPMLGLCGMGEEIEANFGQKPFKFDLAGYINKAIKPTKEAISPVTKARDGERVRGYTPGIQRAKSVSIFSGSSLKRKAVEENKLPSPINDTSALVKQEAVDEQTVEQQDPQPAQHEEEQPVPSLKRPRISIKLEENAAEIVQETSLQHPSSPSIAANNQVSDVEQPVEPFDHQEKSTSPLLPHQIVTNEQSNCQQMASQTDVQQPIATYLEFNALAEEAAKAAETASLAFQKMAQLFRAIKDEVAGVPKSTIIV